jgi:thiol-disulfide isomerase/thioredoxin
MTPKPLKFNRVFYILGIVFSALIVLGILASIIVLTTRDQVKIPQLGDKAPDFTLEGIDGKNVSLSDFRGRKVLLVFDSIRCPASIKQLPYIKATYNQANGDLIVLYVYRNNGFNLVNDYVIENQLTMFPALLDPKDEVGGQLYGLERIVPISVFIDAEGNIGARHWGSFWSQEELESLLETL